MSFLVFFAAIWISTVTVATSIEYKYCSDKPHDQDPTMEFLKLKDAYKVTWAHAVNSPSKLDQVLSGNVMMIKADVQMRHNRSDTEPIMAHPPQTDSNLTLADFIDRVTKSAEKGMKLDFKTLMAVEPSLKLLKNVSDTKSIKNPIWVNADILMGPCYDKVCTPVEPTQFIALCQKYFPSSVLSLGWTTGNDMKPVKNYYTWNNIIEMAKLVYTVSQPVTFPVRASLVKRSLGQLLWLLDISGNLTLTVWSSEKDDIDADDLVELRKKVYDKKNVYYDLPQSQADAFAKALEGVDVSTRPPQNNEVVGSRPYTLQACTDILIGKTSIMFTGKGGWVSTNKEIKARPNSMDTKHFQVEVFFLSLGNQDIQQNITLVFGSNGLTQPTANRKPGNGVQFTVARNGEMTVTKSDGTTTKNSGVADPKFQYRLAIWYGPKMDTIMFVSNSKTDYRKDAAIRYKGDFKPEKFFVLIGVGDQQGAVLVNEMMSAISMRSSTGSAVTRLNLVLLTLVTIVVALSAILINH